MIKRVSFSALSLRDDQILRYAGCKAGKKSVDALLCECKKESENAFSYNACYEIFSVRSSENGVVVGGREFISKDLKKCLTGCERAVVLGATVGVKIDRLINKYSSLSPSKAVMFQAIGAEAIEKLCDETERVIEKEEGVNLAPRFSPGYGDLSIFTQKGIFSMLNLTKNAGICLNDGMTMSPSKSVTAIIGIKNDSRTDQ